MKRLPWNRNLPAQRYTVALDDVVYTVQLVYRLRQSSWYLSLFTAAGVPLVLGQRLVEGTSPCAGLTVGGMPEGLFLVDGGELFYLAAGEL